MIHRPFRPHPILLLSIAVLGCEESDPLPLVAAPTWTTERDYEIGGMLEGDALFSRINHIRVSDDGGRIFVLESGLGRLSVWAPDGSALMELGGVGDGPGEFARASEIQLLSDGFYVRDSRRFTVFADDGTVLETVSYPPPRLSFRGFRLVPRLLLEDGGFLAVPEIPSMVMAGWLGDDPILELPVFHLSRPQGSWTMDTLLVLRRENDALSFGSLGDQPWAVHGKQPYEDSDQAYFDARTGSVTVVEKNVEDGRVEIVEVAPSNNVVWRGELRFAPIPMRMEDVEESIMGWQQAISVPGTSSQDLRRAIEDVLFVPEFFPGVDYRVGMSRGEIWLKTFEEPEADTLVVWYTIQRGEDLSSVRRVLLPNTFAPRDATEMHVWGIRSDSMGVHYVAGRRLVPGDSLR